MKKIYLVFGLFFIVNTMIAQKYYTKTGEILFYSYTVIEEIKAESNSASTVFDLESGKIQWAVLIKSFEFEKSLMQEHFNENYMESSKFPKASFNGEIIGFQTLDLSKDGQVELGVKGKLTIRGIEKPIETTATFNVENSKVITNSKLKILISDYDIEVPSVVSKNIAEEIEITINAEYVLLEQ